MGMRQLIIVRKDLQMSPGKLAAQVAHASMAWLTSELRSKYAAGDYEERLDDNNGHQTAYYHIPVNIDKDIFDGWINGSFTKTVCEAKNLNGINKAKQIADEMGLKEGSDYFVIRDNCLTELTPEEVDENGIGRTVTCIGFKPLADEEAHKISKKFQLYR